MASAVSLVNKDILRYFQTQNLLAPPEAIELTNLYNEMSNILNKPVKYKNKPMQLNLFYDLLSQYGKHLANLKLASSPDDIPPIPAPPSTSAFSTPIRTSTKKSPSTSPPSSAKTLQPSSPTKHDIDPDSEPSTPIFETRTKSPGKSDDSDWDLSPSPIPPSPPKSALKSFVSKLTTNNDIPERVMRLLRDSDDTFQIFPDSNQMIIRGRQVTAQTFLNLLDKLRNPEFRPPHRSQISEAHVAPILERLHAAVSTAPVKERTTILKQLKGLQNYIAGQTRTTRTGAKKALASDPSFTAPSDESPVASTTTAPPSKLVKKISGKGSKRQKYAVVNWKRWQNKIQSLK